MFKKNKNLASFKDFLAKFCGFLVCFKGFVLPRFWGLFVSFVGFWIPSLGVFKKHLPPPFFIAGLAYFFFLINFPYNLMKIKGVYMKNQAFTLIELLVVVLIIGILAAIAVPQYQLAVEKSRMAEAYTITKSIQQAMDLHFLSNGTEAKSFFDNENISFDTTFSCNIFRDDVDDPYCATDNFIYEAYCSSQNSCYINAFRYNENDYSDIRSHYALDWHYYQGKWDTACYYHDALGEKVCKSLQNVELRTF